MIAFDTFCLCIWHSYIFFPYKLCLLKPLTPIYHYSPESIYRLHVQISYEERFHSCTCTNMAESKTL